MPSSALPRRALVPVVALLLLAAPLTACGSDSGSGSSPTVAITADDTSCTVADTTLAAGGVTFKVSNEGSQVTEVYIYADNAGSFSKVVGEVENVGPGTSRDFDVQLAPGTYEVACKPGQQGDGIRQKVTVTGKAAAAGASESSGYDRELELTVDGSGLTGLDPATAEKGERIEFKLRNSTDGTRTLEVLDPAGKVASELDVKAGAEGEAIVELSAVGDWTVKVEGGAKDIVHSLSVS
jgi:iron uptake system component EfeO